MKILMQPSGPSIVFPQPSDSRHALAALLIFTWHSLPAEGAKNRLWDRTFFELALNRWLHFQIGCSDMTTTILFHIGIMSLHCNLQDFHNVIGDFSQPGRVAVALPDAVRDWHRSDDCDIALLHAEQVLAIGRSLVSKRRTSSRDGEISWLVDEPPHIAICVYLAVITAWVAKIVDSQNTDTAKAILSTGCSVLSRLDLRIATGLLNILRRLEEHSIHEH